MPDSESLRETVTAETKLVHPKTAEAIADDALRAQLSAALAPNYTIGSKLGSGGFGSVYRAIHGNTGQEVAVKVLRLESDWPAQTVAARIARFEREAKLCAALRHPNLVRLLDKGHTPTETYYAIFELVPGETLRDLLERERRLSVERVADLMSQVLDAVATAHAAGVVHRDLKPANIMVVNTGLTTHVKVLDFGISTLTLDARDADFHDVTQSHELIGTPRYCAPEQLRGDLPTPKTDLYAWGLVFLECITGQPAISGTAAEIYNRHLSPLEIPLPRGIVGHPLGEFLRRVLLKNPEERAGNAAQLHTEFKLLPLGDLVGALSDPSPEVTERPAEQAATFSMTEVRIERRHVTAIAVNLRLVPTGEQLADAEVLDPILRDQLSVCREALVRYGGVITGEMGESLVVMFGYPVASDGDARRAVRTVLELSEDIRMRGERLSTTHRLALQFRVGIHTGPITVKQGQVPTGITPTRALTLSAAADTNTIVVSPESRRLFESFAELEVGVQVPVSGVAQPVQTAWLVGERRGEALSFRPEQSASNEFIGRRAELGQLDDHLAGRRGRGFVRAALVVGEAGIGKSRLVREFLRKARDGGRSVLECRCLAEHRNIALSPVLPVLRHQLGLHSATDRLTGDSMVAALNGYGLDPARFVPIVCVWLSLPLPDGFQPAQVAPFRQRELLLEALVVVLT